MMVNSVNGGYKNLPTSSGGKRGRNKCYATGTYVKLVACVIQNSPNRMLPFKQIMKKLEPSVFGDRKRIENNIRVCLSSHSCFTKVPVDPQYPNPQKNYWKVDESGITPKMLRRHFNDIIEMFPGLSHQTLQRETFGNAVVHQPIPPICNVPANKREVTFTGPFSIDSILKSDLNVMQSTCLKGRLPYQEDAHCVLNSLKPVSGYSTTDLYSFKSLGCEFDTVQSSRLFTGSQCGPPVSSQAFDDCVLHSNYCSSPQIYASTRYAGW